VQITALVEKTMSEAGLSFTDLAALEIVGGAPMHTRTAVPHCARQCYTG
jgi:hypothetical protein